MNIQVNEFFYLQTHTEDKINAGLNYSLIILYQNIFSREKINQQFNMICVDRDFISFFFN